MKTAISPLPKPIEVLRERIADAEDWNASRAIVYAPVTGIVLPLDIARRILEALEKQ